MRLLVSTAAVLIALAFAGVANATTYYVRAQGSDSSSGRSKASAWRTVDRVNRAALRPGDTVLFEGGATFGDATLEATRSGTAAAPIEYRSYGSGNARLTRGV